MKSFVDYSIFFVAMVILSWLLVNTHYERKMRSQIFIDLLKLALGMVIIFVLMLLIFGGV